MLFPTFLDSIRDCTYINMDEYDLTDVLNNLIISSINDFLFPKCSLEYAEDSKFDPLDGDTYGYYFVDEEIGDAEYKVILAFMKVH